MLLITDVRLYHGSITNMNVFMMHLGGPSDVEGVERAYLVRFMREFYRMCVCIGYREREVEVECVYVRLFQCLGLRFLDGCTGMMG